MKKILLLIFVLMGWEINVEAQANLTYESFDSLSFGNVNAIVDSVVFNMQFAFYSV